MYIKLTRMQLSDAFPADLGLAFADLVVPVVDRDDQRIKNVTWHEGIGGPDGHVVLIEDIALALRERRFDKSAAQLLESTGQSRVMWFPAHTCEPAYLH